MANGVIPSTLARGLTTTTTAARTARRRAGPTRIMQPEPRALTRGGEITIPTPAKHRQATNVLSTLPRGGRARWSAAKLTIQRPADTRTALACLAPALRAANFPHKRGQ